MQEESGQTFVQDSIEESGLNNTDVCILHDNGNVSEVADRESVLHVDGVFNASILEVITIENSYASNSPPSSLDEKEDISMQEDPAINLQVESVEGSNMEVSEDDRIQILTDSEGKFTRKISTQTDTYLPTTPNGNRCSHCDEGRNCNNTDIPTTPKGRRWSNCNKGTNASPSFVFNSPTKVILRNELNNQ